MRNRYSRRRLRISPSFTAGLSAAVVCSIVLCPLAQCQNAAPIGTAGGVGTAGGAGAAGGYATGAPANEVTKFSGTLKDARGNVIIVTREDGTDCMVQFPDDITLLSFTAKAVPAALQRGTPIRFAMAIGPNGAPISPVEKIEIFSPLGPGMVPRNQAARFTPGVHQAGRQPRQAGASMGGKVDVVGTLMMVTPQGGISVQAGGTPVNTMVTQDVEIEVQVNNLSLAQAGDEVEVEGFYNPPDETKVKAQRIKITSDRVMGETPNPANRKERRKSKQDAKTAPPQQDPAAPAPETP
tara:strand:- start:106 stop:993 length:888 start_codon:yes stop_codon:yes gene_type:complete